MTVGEVFKAAGLQPSGPSPWDSEIDELRSGVYVVAAKGSFIGCPLCPAKTEKLRDIDLELEKLLWIPSEEILYIGQTTKQTLRKRVSQFYRHRYGDAGPHKGGQAIHLLDCKLEVYWSPADHPLEAEERMLCVFMKQRGRIPYANRHIPSGERPINRRSVPNVSNRSANSANAASSANSARKLAIVNIGQLLTLAGPARPRVGAELRELGIVENAALLIEGGRIKAAGAYAEIKPLIPPGTNEIDASGRCVTPGFVDAHTHLVFAGNRAGEFEQRIAGATYQQIAAAGGGIASTVRQTRAATEDELLAESRRHRDWMLRAGTTTMEAKSGYGLDRETELRMLRVMKRLNDEGPTQVVPTLLAAHCLPPEFAGRREEYVRWVAEELIPEVAAAKLAEYCDAFCDDCAFTVEETRTVLEAARHNGLKLRVHAEQFRPGTGAALAAELGAVTADHLEAATPETLAQLRAAGVQPVLLPGSVFALGHTLCPPARAMVELGLSIVIATDFNPGSSPIASMPLILSLACLEMKLTPAEALTAATVNAAWSLGLGNKVGSLEPGKQSDFLIHEFGDYRELVYFIAAPARPRVFIGGREIST